MLGGFASASLFALPPAAHGRKGLSWTQQSCPGPGTPHRGLTQPHAKPLGEQIRWPTWVSPAPAAEGAPGLGTDCIAGIKVDCWEQGRPLKYVC